LPTVRTPIKRAVRSRVTDEAREVFARAVEVQGIYRACVRSEGCRSTSRNEHCAECREFLELNGELDRLLGIKPWETSPLDCDSEAAPDYMRASSLQSQDWRKAWEMRCALESK
jgi:hypothetical protein